VPVIRFRKFWLIFRAEGRGHLGGDRVCFRLPVFRSSAHPMKIQLDENLPHRLANLSQGLGHDTSTVHGEQLIGHTDNEIWQAARKESRFLIAQDLDSPTCGGLSQVRTKEDRSYA
jgi:Domain of unknown function (DUF5615)